MSTTYSRLQDMVKKKIKREYMSSWSIAKSTQCRQRDGDCCLVTKGGDCNEVAYIYPYSLGTKVGSKEHRDFWKALADFWSPTQIKEWEDIVLGPERTEILPNLMCLVPTVHGLWGRAKFAIKHIEISNDKSELTVEFYWLGGSVCESKDIRIPPAQTEQSRFSQPRD
ncbi:uncharacterized protein BDV17DRAFT_258388 [Aspergillus undulatus]|uniref:uncharacterized protein n=1 Tax=Aspergillus undulatus TaxID=1810928 RepID=UPI003CCDEE6F